MGRPRPHRSGPVCGGDYEPGRWSLDDHRFANLWGPGPPPEMMEAATPVAWIGIALGPRAGLNHYAWGVESLAILGQLGDVLARNGGRFIWGPGRHGAGRNLFT